MAAAIEALYAGIASQIDANQSLTVTLAGNAITFVPIYLSEKEKYLAQIQHDVQKYLIASLEALKSPSEQSNAARWSEQKNLDTSKMDSQTNQISTLIENFKSDAQSDESDLQVAIGMQIPMNGYLKSLVNLIGHWF